MSSWMDWDHTRAKDWNDPRLLTPYLHGMDEDGWAWWRAIQPEFKLSRWDRFRAALNQILRNV